MRPQGKKIVVLISSIIALLFAMSTAAQAVDYDEGGIRTIVHRWGSQRINTTLWGIATGDLDGSGSRALILLEKNRVWLGQRKADKLVAGSTYTWPDDVHALRLYTMDLDGDGRDEIVVSAVSYGMPASFILTLDDGEMKPLLVKIPWHLRSLRIDGRTALIGQRSSPDEFFTGKIYRLALEEGKLVRGKPLPLRRWTDIFQFALLPDDVMIALKGYAPLKAYEKRGTKWKRFWTSHGRYGGTLRAVNLKSRPPLQDLPRYHIPVGREPLPLKLKGISSMIASRHDMPLRNMIAQRELLRGGWIVGFTKENALGFSDVFTTKRLPGFIADFCIDTDTTSGKKTLYVALQTEPNVFRPSLQSSVLMFDLP